jgi:hypothetical protein
LVKDETLSFIPLTDAFVIELKHLDDATPEGKRPLSHSTIQLLDQENGPRSV